MMSYDSSPAESRRARDAEQIAPSDNSDAIDMIAKWARANLSPAGIDNLIGALSAIGEKKGAMTIDEACRYGHEYARKFVMNESPNRSAKTSALAADASYENMFPQAGRIGRQDYGAQPQRRGAVMSSAAVDSYSKMFPDTARIDSAL